MSELDITGFFACYSDSKEQFNIFVAKYFQGNDPTIDPTTIMLALQQIFSIEDKVNSKQLNGQSIFLKKFLRKWRNEARFSAYSARAYLQPWLILRSFTIFKHFDVPLFIDDHGKRMLMSDFFELHDIDDIDENTSIFHVTHSEEAFCIVGQKKLKPSDNKNIVPGVWFGIDDPAEAVLGSVYGNRSFVFTMKDLRIKGLYQGDVVSFDNEVNVILYATDDCDARFHSLKMPTEKAAKDLLKTDKDVAVKISIFVPGKLIESYFLKNVPPEPAEVDHTELSCAKKLHNKDSQYVCSGKST